MFFKLDIARVDDTIPERVLVDLEFSYSLPKSFYTGKEWTAYITARCRQLSRIEDG